MTYSIRKPLKAAFVGTVAISLGACAPMDAPQANAADAEPTEIDTSRSCFTQREIRGYAAAPDGPNGRERIYLDTGIHEQFVLETIGPCPDLDFSLRIALDTRTMGSICTGDVETLVIPSAIPQEFGQCPVRVLGRLVEE